MNMRRDPKSVADAIMMLIIIREEFANDLRWSRQLSPVYPRATGGWEDTFGARIGEQMPSRLAEICVSLEVQRGGLCLRAGAASFPWSDAEW